MSSRIDRALGATARKYSLVVALILLVVPWFWMGKFYFVGGDNSQLFYLMPRTMMGSYVFNVVVDNALGTLGAFGQQVYQAPFLGMLYLLKSVLPDAVNIQALFWGLNLAFSFLGFYWLLGLWIDGDDFDARLIRVIGGIAYCSSLYVVATMWKHVLYAMYLVALYPLVLYLFLRSVREQSGRLAVMAALLATLFGVVLAAVPWLVGTVLVTLPLLVWHQIEYPRTFRYAVFFIVVLVGLNAFWLAPMAYSLVTPGNIFGALQATETNESIIHEVTSQNNIAFPLLGSSMPRWVVGMDGAAWLSMLPSGVLAMTIVAAGIFARRSRRFFGIYLAGVVGWLAAIYLYTVRIDSWGYNLFVWLNLHLPGFAMFRNNFDKFSVGIAFAFAFLAAVSLAMLSRSFWQSRRLARQLLLLVVFAVVVVGAWPFLHGGLYDKPMWTTKATYNMISRFNDDFISLVTYLKQQPGDVKYLWLPLNTAGYIQIADAELPDHYYSGPSPLRFLADKSDFTGRFSFGPQEVGERLFEAIVNREAGEVESLFKRMNVGYVIVNRDISRDLTNSYLYGHFRSGDLYHAQVQWMAPLILGEHMRDFGNRYSLYKIKPELMLGKIHLAGSEMDEITVKWRKLASSEYVITLDGLRGLKKLVFLEPFHSGWVLTTPSGHQLTPPLVRHERGHGYANTWVLDTAGLVAALPQADYIRAPDGSLSLDIRLKFAPARWVPYWFAVSGVALAACFLYLAAGLMRRRGAV